MGQLIGVDDGGAAFREHRGDGALAGGDAACESDETHVARTIQPAPRVHSVIPCYSAAVRKPLTVLALIGAVLTTLVACGGSNSSGNLTNLPTIQFVGNSSCPTSGASPYFTDSSGNVKPAPVNSQPPVGEPVNEMPHTHVLPPAQVTYDHNPPTSGCHYNLGYGQAPIQAGVYNSSPEIQPEYWVHNLEHGYVVVLYNCPSGCDAQFTALRNWYHSLPPDPTTGYAKVLVIPYSEMSVPFACVSWDWYYPIPVFSIDEVQKFYANHIGNAPEPNAP